MKPTDKRLFIEIGLYVDPIIAKTFPKIFFLAFHSGGRNVFYRWPQDLTFGDICPPTLTLPLGGGREGWG
jgi:hypothetical protein